MKPMFGEPRETLPFLREVILPVGLVAHSLIASKDGDLGTSAFSLFLAIGVPVFLRKINEATDTLSSFLFVSKVGEVLSRVDYGAIYVVDFLLVVAAAYRAWGMIWK